MPYFRNSFNNAAATRPVLVFDRRKRHFVRGSAHATLLSVRRVKSRLDNGYVHVATFQAKGEAENAWPELLRIDEQEYRRLMDSFYIPIGNDVGISSVLFDTIANEYDQLVCLDLNAAVTLKLLRAVAIGPDNCPAEILDFGCGTGIANRCIEHAGLQGKLHLVGTDISSEMIELCKTRKEDVLTFDNWRRIDTPRWDGAIASFVLHYGVPLEDLERLSRQLRSEAKFAANFFKADNDAISKLVERLKAFGLNLAQTFAETTPRGSANPILIFEKV